MGILQKLVAFFNSDAKAINEQRINPATPDRIATFDDAEKYFKAFGLYQYFENIKPSIRPKIDIELTPIEEVWLNAAIEGKMEILQQLVRKVDVNCCDAWLVD